MTPPTPPTPAKVHRIRRTQNGEPIWADLGPDGGGRPAQVARGAIAGARVPSGRTTTFHSPWWHTSPLSATGVARADGHAACRRRDDAQHGAGARSGQRQQQQWQPRGAAEGDQGHQRCGRRPHEWRGGADGCPEAAPCTLTRSAEAAALCERKQRGGAAGGTAAGAAQHDDAAAWRQAAAQVARRLALRRVG